MLTSSADAFLVYMPPPIPRCSNWAYSSLNSPSYFSLLRYGSRIGLHIFLFEACSTFTRVAACTLALSPIRDTLIEGFSHFVTSMTAPIASGWSGCRVGLAPTGKRRLCTAHAKNGCRRAKKKPPEGGSQFKRDDRGSSECYLIQLPPILLCLSHHQSQYLFPCFRQFAMNSPSVHSFVLEGF